MKHLLIITGIVASFIIINTIEHDYNYNLYAVNQELVNACTIDMQHNPDLICD